MRAMIARLMGALVSRLGVPLVATSCEAQSNGGAHQLRSAGQAERATPLRAAISRVSDQAASARPEPRAVGWR